MDRRKATVLLIGVVALAVVGTAFACSGAQFADSPFVCGYFAIINYDSGKCLTVDGDNLQKNGATIYLDEYEGLDSQLWMIALVATDQYVIVNKASTKAMIVDWATEAQMGANIKQWEYQGHVRQRWALVSGDIKGSQSDPTNVYGEDPLRPLIRITRVESNRSDLMIQPDEHASGWTNAVQSVWKYVDDWLDFAIWWIFQLVEPF